MNPAERSKAIAHKLIEYGPAPEGLWRPTADEATNAFLRSDPFAFLCAEIFNYQIDADRAWRAPLILKKRLGYFDVRRFAEDEPALRAAIRQRPMLHRFADIVASRVSGAARMVLEKYDGDAANIWAGTQTAEKLRRRFEEFSGIGPKIANNAVENVISFMRLPVAEIHGADIAPDRHVRRVFLRTGLADRDDLVHIRDVARALNPEHPAALDYGAWLIGQRFCRPTEVICSACPLDDACPKQVERGGRVG